MDVEKCPKCGQPVSHIERQRVGRQVYYLAVHYYGYTRTPEGKIKKIVKRCYLGPRTYIYVSRTLCWKGGGRAVKAMYCLAKTRRCLRFELGTLIGI